LLDGKRVCTHWARAGALARRFPALDVDAEPIFIRDGDVWTSAGVTAGIDLALAVVEHDHGAEVAQVVARWLVMFLRRPGGQAQFAAPIWSERAELEPVRAAQELIEAEPGADHRVGVLASRVGMSARHFTRRFTEEVGISPGQYVAAVRTDAARRELEATGATVDLIARRCGFGTAETMRRTFTRRIGVSPDQYRRRFRTISHAAHPSHHESTARTDQSNERTTP
jgi:transcriptional regulator GlxA family with amidase domain